MHLKHMADIRVTSVTETY